MAPKPTQAGYLPRVAQGGSDVYHRANSPDEQWRLWIEGEAFPRIVIDPRGTGILTAQILVGDGTAPPTPLSGGGGSLPDPVTIGHGGTGQTAAAAGFDALAPTSARGDLIARGAASNGALPIGANGRVLASNGTDPGWVSPAGIDSTALHAANNLSDVANAPAARGNIGAARGLTPTGVKTAAYSAVDGDLVECDTASIGAFPVTLPTNPADKTTIGISLVAQSGTNAVSIVAGGGDKFDVAGGTSTASVATLFQVETLQYAANAISAGNGIWYRVSGRLGRGQLDLRYDVPSRVTFNNAAYPMASTDTYVAQVGTLTAPRTVTLPTALSVGVGRARVIVDESNTCTATNTISIARNGTDTINGGTAPYVITSADAPIILYSNGLNGWIASRPNSNEVKQLLAGAGARLTTSGDSTTLDVLIDVQEFSVVGAATWTKPANALYCYVEVICGGPGGGGGKTALAGTIRLGGGGAGAGGVKRRWLKASDLGATETVTVGDGGTGGAGGTTGGSNGSNGTNGNTSSFGAHVAVTCVLGVTNAANGNTGAGGAGCFDGEVNTDLYAGSTITAHVGGSSSSTASAGNGGSGSGGPGSGGGGGGIDAANVKRAGGGGGAGDPSTISAGVGGTTAADGNVGTAGADATTSHGMGAGGGGGAPSTSASVSGGVGGAGGFPGGGGGGGGASVSGGTALGGAGGKGGRGRVRVVTYIGTP